jgi:hypothetical protein
LLSLSHSAYLASLHHNRLVLQLKVNHQTSLQEMSSRNFLYLSQMPTTSPFHIFTSKRIYTRIVFASSHHHQRIKVDILE